MLVREGGRSSYNGSSSFRTTSGVSFHPSTCHVGCVVPPAPTIADIKTWIRELNNPSNGSSNGSSSSSSSSSSKGPALDRSDLYVRQTQVVIQEAATLWVEVSLSFVLVHRSASIETTRIRACR